MTSLKLQLAKVSFGKGHPPLPKSVAALPSGTGPNNLGPQPSHPTSKKAVLLAGSDSFVFDITSADSGTDDAGHIVWEEIPRPQGLPFLVDSSRRLMKKRYVATIYKGGKPVDVDLRNLHFMSSRPTVMTFAYGEFETGQYRMTSLAINPKIREAGTNNVISAEVEFVLTQANDLPVPKPIPNAPAPPTPQAPAAPATDSQRIHTVARGDSLWSIANHFYGAGSAWKRIAEANSIKNANRIDVGQRLVIP